MNDIANADNSGLQPRGLAVKIGSVEMVNGSKATEVPQFVVTRGELLELVKHWEYTFLSRTYFVFTTDQIGSTDLRLAPYAERRVARIVRLLGDEAVRAVDEVMDGFAERLGSRNWEKFRRYLGPNHLHGVRNGAFRKKERCPF
jgi:hypothetical protein